MAQFLDLIVESLAVLPTDPTGDPCFNCMDIPYLEARTLRAYFNGGEKDLIYLCPSCGQELEERLNERFSDE